ncbi:hypothetical protein BD414DRAFT_489557 [Trametes punicea]|nr:hypothetical protein BD414DRAFT_489557 [Trametes punicea]
MASQVKEQAKKNPVFEMKKNTTLVQCVEILNWYHANSRNQTKSAQHFDKIYPNLKLKQLTVSTWVKEEAKWHQQ